MKSFLIIGTGSFGRLLCKELAKTKADIMIADKTSEKMEEILPLVVSAKIADCTNQETLRTFDIPSFDACFVCIGGNFQNSLEITSLLKELGAKKVISKAEKEVQAKFLLRNGADEVIFPEKDIAQRVAISESSKLIFDYLELSKDCAIYEIEARAEWLGKTIKELNFRAAYNLNILACKKETGAVPITSIDYVFKKNEHLYVMGTKKDIAKVTAEKK